MSKRAEELAKRLYPYPKLEDYDDTLVYRADRENAFMGRIIVVHVYEHAEKDTIERAVMWLEEHADEYNGSESAFDHMEEEMITDFRKAMEELNR